MKRFIVTLVSLSLLTSLTSCENKDNENKLSEESISDAVETTATEETIGEKESVETTVSKITEEKNYVYDTFSSVEYLEEDDKFILTGRSGVDYAVDKNGKAVDLSFADLKTKKLTGPDIIIDINGNDVTERFISDENNEEVVGCCDYEGNYVVWIYKQEESPTESLKYLICYDYDGNVLTTLEESDYDFVGKGEDLSVMYLNEDIFGFYVADGYSSHGTSCVNIKSGETFGVKRYGGDKFTDGLIIDTNWDTIVNTHGETVFDDEKIKGNVFYVGEGMVMNWDDGMFYNIEDLSVAIDLSEYSFTGTGDGFGHVDWGKTSVGAFTFIDGLCGIRMSNDNGTCFFGVIDTSGNWVLEPMEVKDSSSYKGKFTDTLWNVNEQIYDSETGEFYENPENTNSDPLVVDGKEYWIDGDSSEFCYYDFNTKEQGVITPYIVDNF